MSTISNYDPFRNFRSLQGEINRLFDRGLDDTTGQMTLWPMRVDIKEDEHQIVISSDVPGMEQKEIKVNIDNNMLTISGERKFDDEENKEKYHRVERTYGRFSRTFQLPNFTDAGKIQASYKNGVLEVTLPKLEEAKPRSIQVQVN
ncbi:MAG: Hsp20/alpha crystallin family protein [Magnetococcales bacterium]|nr:Hsp20/alpha crystallin family protein [Magnetococcales bacterium]